jgi:bacillithiol system protein YtxJ
MIVHVTTLALVEDAVTSRAAVVYKHSARCGSCLAALQEVQRFAEDHPELPVYQVDVMAERRLSDAIAERLGVRHASPQVIVVSDGRATWSATHWSVTASALVQQVARAGAA